MKNRSLLNFLSVVLVAGLMVSCMGLEDTAPDVATMPEIHSFEIVNVEGFDYELTATVAKEDVVKIVECGFYVSEYRSMQNAERIESKLIGQVFMAELSLSVEGEKKYVCAFLSVGTGHVEVCSEVKTLVAGETVPEPAPEPEIGGDLSKTASANCYIVSEAGTYSFKAVRGNGTESVGAVKSVDVLWESFGTATAPKVGDLIKSVSCSDGYVTFETSDTFSEGNAVIAARGAYDEILWSWHIWFTDAPGTCSYRNVDKLMMDRNLGATSATPGDVGALGLLYQWGRKDPFLGSSSISSDVESKSTLTWPSPVSSSSSRGTVAYATEHPTTFITYNSSNYDWYYTGDSNTDNTRWQSNKTIYDPCPAGWRVPDGGSSGVWAQAGFPSGSNAHSYDSSDEGMLFGSGISSPASWYPAAGYRLSDDGGLSGVGYYGVYWSVAPNGDNAYSLYFSYYGSVFPADYDGRADGQSVRCLQE